MTSATSDLDLATWTQTGTSFTVTYPLNLFHEIDFLVNEGYRSIPYGGIEVGGLLFGHSDQKSARIDALRMISCEHASGPSFVLSERDISGLKEQLDAASADPDLEGLEAIGWFISHTRRNLQMNDHESVVFDQFFSKPGMITLLVKPERFKPTRFGFLVRDANGELERDATGHAIILPLGAPAGRAAGAPTASIPASREIPDLRTPEALDAVKTEPVPEILARAQELEAPAETPPSAERLESPVDIAVPPPGADVPAEKPIAPQDAEGPSEKPIPAQERDIPEGPSETVTSLPALPQKDASSPSEGLPGSQSRALQLSQSFETRLAHEHITRRMREDAARSNARLITVLFLAAAMGCAVGYWGYLQLPSPIIPLTVRTQGTALMVSWPPEQTRDAVYAGIRVDDSEPRPLTAEDKAAGQTQINPPGNNVKIELIAQHWMRDSRGIIRYVRGVQPVAAPVPSLPEPEQPNVHRRGRRH